MKYFIICIFVLLLSGTPDKTFSQTPAELIGTADSLAETGRYGDAVTLGIRAVDEYRKLYGDNDSTLAEILYKLGYYYVNLRNNEAAREYLTQALVIQEKLPGNRRNETATSLYYLAATYMRMQEYATAESLFVRAIDIREAIFGQNHVETARSLIGYIGLKGILGQYDQAIELAHRVLKIFRENLDPNSIDIAKALENLANLVGPQGKTGEAIEYYRKALDIRNNISAADDLEKARVILNLAKVHYLLGQYNDARRFLTSALAMNIAFLGEKHERVASIYIDLGLLYMAQSDYSEGEKNIRQALAILESREKRNLADMAKCYHYLGDLYFYLGNYSEVEDYLLQAKKYTIQMLGEDHLEVALINNSLADYYLSQKKYPEADSLYIPALGIITQKLGRLTPFILRSYNGLGISYTEQGKFDEALSQFNQALEIENEIYGDNNLQLAKTINLMGRCYFAQGEIAPCLEFTHRSLTIMNDNLRLIAEIMSESDALKYSQMLRHQVSDYLSYYWSAADKKDSLTAEAIDIVINTKGPISDLVFNRNRFIRMNVDSRSAALIEQIKAHKNHLANLFIRGLKHESKSDNAWPLDTLAMKIARLEEELANYCRFGQSGIVSATNITARDIVQNLPDKSVLVEYFRHNQIIDRNNPSPHYSVVLIFSEGKTAFLDLGEAAPIDSLIEEYSGHIARLSTAGHDPDISDQAEYHEIAGSLYEKIWKPFETRLGDSLLVFIAPDGGLNLLSFAGLKVSEHAYLIEHYPIQYLSAGRDIIYSGADEAAGQGLLAMGDPDYDCDLLQTGNSAVKPNTWRKPLFSSDKYRSVDLPDIRFGLKAERLSGTRNEIEDVCRLWANNFEGPVTVFMGTEATEKNFKNSVSKKQVIHLATHGFFFSTPDNNSRSGESITEANNFVNENPLLLSGFLLAGANNVIDDTVNFNIDDGILTAEEISALDFSGCRWVILSACQSGLGMVKSGEGVYGLRRAFQAAGAGAVISSLWKVSDQGTADLMTRLYRPTDENLPRKMQKIMQEQLNKIRKRHQPDHPFLWAAFISIGDWRKLSQ